MMKNGNGTTSEAGKKIGAVILAAGASGISKGDMLKREIDTLRDGDISPIAVVTGHDEEDVRRTLSHRRVIFVTNGDYENTRMFDSIKLGLDALDKRCAKALIVHADAPSFSVETVRSLMNASGDMVFPVHRGRAGHPFSVDMTKLDAVLSYDGKDGIQGLLKRDIIKATFIDVDDPGIHMKAREAVGLEDVMRYQKSVIMSRPVRCEIGFSLSRAHAFFDEDLAALLMEIEKSGSMNSACKSLNMAYSRGWKKMKKAEEMLGCSLIKKQIGGRGGGGSALTEEGKKHLKKYEDIRKAIVDFAERAVREQYRE